MMKTLTAAALSAGLLLTATFAVHAEEVGKVGVDWVGNDIIIEAVQDPKVKGVTCHITYFDRSVIDRLRKGNWFEDPSNNAISCNQTGPIEIGDIDLSKGGEQTFRQGMSLIWKNLVVTRVYDKSNDTLVYLISSEKVIEGSAKMAIATVPLFNQSVTWQKGKP
jgi:CreA protein